MSRLLCRLEGGLTIPSGGTLWTPRYFVRRTAWHTLNHAWEIEDRSVGIQNE